MAMPQQDPVQKALAESKKVLEGADKLQKAAGGPLKTQPSKTMQPAAPAPVKKKSPSAGIIAGTADAAAGVKAKADNITEYNKGVKASGGEGIPQYEKGGKVKKTGVAKVHEGETVLPADDKKKSEKLAMDHLHKKAGIMSQAVKEVGEAPETPETEKAEGKAGEKKEAKKADYARTEIEHHKNGTHTVKRHHRIKESTDGKVAANPEPDTFAVQNMDELKEALEHGAPEGASAMPAEGQASGQ